MTSYCAYLSKPSASHSKIRLPCAHQRKRPSCGFGIAGIELDAVGDLEKPACQRNLDAAAAADIKETHRAVMAARQKQPVGQVRDLQEQGYPCGDIRKTPMRRRTGRLRNRVHRAVGAGEHDIGDGVDPGTRVKNIARARQQRESRAPFDLPQRVDDRAPDCETPVQVLQPVRFRLFHAALAVRAAAQCAAAQGCGGACLGKQARHPVGLRVDAAPAKGRPDQPRRQVRCQRFRLRLEDKGGVGVTRGNVHSGTRQDR